MSKLAYEGVIRIFCPACGWQMYEPGPGKNMPTDCPVCKEIEEKIKESRRKKREGGLR